MTVVIGWIAPPARGSSISEKRVELLFRPHRGEQMALSPDGRYLAYTEHVGHELTIVVFDLQRLAIKTRIIADEDRLILHSKERERAQLRFLKWAAGNQLVFAPTVEVIESGVQAPAPELAATLGLPSIAPMPPRIIAPIMAVEADGQRPRQLADAKDFQTILSSERAVMRPPQVKGFLAGDRSRLALEVQGTNGEPTQLLKVSVETGKIDVVQSEMSRGNVAYDWKGHARLNRINERGGAGSTLFYRLADSNRWQPLEPPRGSTEPVRFGISPDNHYGEKAIPLGFDFDPNVLIYASNVGRNTFGIYGLDLKTWRRTPLSVEHPNYDLSPLDVGLLPSNVLVFDEHQQRLVGVRASGTRAFTVWLDGELAEVQRTLETKFPQRTVHVLEWSDPRTEFVCRVTGGTEPGRIYLFRPQQDTLTELSRAAPWLPNAELHATKYFELAGPGGGMLSGFLTLPRSPKLNPPPLIIWFATGMPPRPHSEFSAQAQVLADMGFVVCRLNFRGLLGFGARERDVLRADIDGVPAADALAAVDWIASRHRIDRKRVATMGEGFAGLLAIRATQLHPETFRCAVALEPILNPAAWVEPPPESPGQPTFQQRANRLYLTGKGSDLHRISPLAHADRLNAPVFFTKRIVPRSATDVAVAEGTSRLHGQLKRRDIPSVVAEIHDDYVAGSPGARTRVYRKLEEFFNLNLYEYNVKIGPTREVK